MAVVEAVQPAVAVVERRLVVDGRAVCAVEVAGRTGGRMRGLLGRDGLEGALLLPHEPGVHTFGMRFAIDVAFLDRRSVVLEVVRMAPGRFGRPRLRARSVLEAEAGRFEAWGLVRGSRVEIERR
jgi:hypothetical protein